MSPSKGPRKYQSNVTVAFGLVTIQGNLYPIASKDKEDSFKTACPDCAAKGVASGVSQGYTCLTDSKHGPHPMGECVKAKQVGDKLVLLTKEEIEKIRVDEEDSEPRLDLSVHPASQVDTKAWPTGNTYWLEPLVGNEQSYGLLADLAAERTGDDGLAFVGTMTLRKSEKLFRLVRTEFGLVLQEIFRPEQVHTFQVPETNYKGSLIEVAIKLVDELKADFDPDTYKSKVNERLAALIAAKGDEGTPVTNGESAASGGNDLAAQLEASLAAVNAA